MNSFSSEIPHSSLVTTDYIIILIYLLVLVGFALYMKITKRSGSDTESYFLGGRKIPGWLNGISYAATSMNTGKWFGYLNRYGKPLLTLKGGKWKGFFHVPRSIYRNYRTFETLVKNS